jgi:hypothetical protein
MEDNQYECSGYQYENCVSQCKYICCQMQWIQSSYIASVFAEVLIMHTSFKCVNVLDANVNAVSFSVACVLLI